MSVAKCCLRGAARGHASLLIPGVYERPFSPVTKKLLVSKIRPVFAVAGRKPVRSSWKNCDNEPIYVLCVAGIGVAPPCRFNRLNSCPLLTQSGVLARTFVYIGGVARKSISFGKLSLYGSMAANPADFGLLLFAIKHSNLSKPLFAVRSDTKGLMLQTADLASSFNCASNSHCER